MGMPVLPAQRGRREELVQAPFGLRQRLGACSRHGARNSKGPGVGTFPQPKSLPSPLNLRSTNNSSEHRGSVPSPGESHSPACSPEILILCTPSSDGPAAILTFSAGRPEPRHFSTFWRTFNMIALARNTCLAGIATQNPLNRLPTGLGVPAVPGASNSSITTA